MLWICLKKVEIREPDSHRKIKGKKKKRDARRKGKLADWLHQGICIMVKPDCQHLQTCT